jgi:hypothetical protein
MTKESGQQLEARDDDRREHKPAEHILEQGSHLARLSQEGTALRVSQDHPLEAQVHQEFRTVRATKTVSTSPS